MGSQLQKPVKHVQWVTDWLVFIVHWDILHRTKGLLINLVCFGFKVNINLLYRENCKCSQPLKMLLFMFWNLKISFSLVHYWKHDDPPNSSIAVVTKTETGIIVKYQISLLIHFDEPLILFQVCLETHWTNIFAIMKVYRITQTCCTAATREPSGPSLLKTWPCSWISMHMEGQCQSRNTHTLESSLIHRIFYLLI